MRWTPSYSLFSYSNTYLYEELFLYTQPMTLLELRRETTACQVDIVNYLSTGILTFHGLSIYAYKTGVNSVTQKQVICR